MASQRSRAQVYGVRDTMRDLRRLEPEIYKQTMREIKQAAKPLQVAAQANIPTDPPLSGMGHQGRTGWSKKNARVSINTGGRSRKKAGGYEWTLIKVRLNGASGGIFDMAGRASAGSTPQGQNLVAVLTSRFGGASRAMWPAAQAKLDTVQGEVIDAVRKASLYLNRELQTNDGGWS